MYGNAHYEDLGILTVADDVPEVLEGVGEQLQERSQPDQGGSERRRHLELRHPIASIQFSRRVASCRAGSKRLGNCFVPWGMIHGHKDDERKHRPTILVLDDSVNVAKTLAMVLEQSGYSVVAAHSSEQGLELAVRNAINLALIDVNLPDTEVKTAVALCKQLPRCKILLLSGEGTSELLERALKERVDFPILAKPPPPYSCLRPPSRCLNTSRTDGRCEGSSWYRAL